MVARATAQGVVHRNTGFAAMVQAARGKAIDSGTLRSPAPAMHICREGVLAKENGAYEGRRFECSNRG
jgi:hypothetical protein